MRTEIHPETTQNRFDQLASDGIKEYGNFVRTLENAGVRMARATKFKHAEQFINSVIGVDRI